jgi:large subunit ribosomal protein L4
VKLSVRNAEGKEVRKLEVDGSVFGIEPNMAVLHQAFVAQRANQRSGTAQTKSRGEVRGSTRKIRMQKYTGRARAGSARSPTRVGGGVAFGPRRRDYSQALPKKMRRLAIRSALSGKVADGQLVVVDKLSMESPKTREMLRILRNVGIERAVLIVTGQSDRMVLASIRNLEKTKVLPAAYLNVVDMLNHRDVLMTEDAVRVAEKLWGEKRAAAAPVAESAPKRRRAAKEKPPAVEASAAEAPAEAKPRRRTRKAAAEGGEA